MNASVRFFLPRSPALQSTRHVPRLRRMSMMQLGGPSKKKKQCKEGSKDDVYITFLYISRRLCPAPLPAATAPTGSSLSINGEVEPGGGGREKGVGGRALRVGL